jgi:uncharacterized protein YbjT (DUF2867 family)
MKKILVLGGTGFVGAHVCEKLVRDGWHVTVPTRRRNNARHLLHLPPLTVLELDVHDELALTHAVAGHDAVVNLVAILHGTEAAFHRVHVALPQKLAKACLAGGVTQVVHVSALGANAQQPESAPSMYLRSKGQGEAVLLQAASGAVAGVGAGGGFELTCLRPSVIFGGGDQFLNLFARLQKIFPIMPLAGAQARFQPVWVEDVASAVVRCVQPTPPMARVHQSPMYELCGPEVFTLKQLVELSGQLSGIAGGRGRWVVGLPAWAGRLQASLIGLAPGQPLMSLDNLDSMKVDNVATGQCPGLKDLGITPTAVRPIAADYLSSHSPEMGLPGLRLKARHR